MDDLFERTVFGWVLAWDFKKLMAQIAKVVVEFTTPVTAASVKFTVGGIIKNTCLTKERPGQACVVYIHDFKPNFTLHDFISSGSGPAV